MSKTRLEHDLLGDLEVPETALYGVQTLRAVENFKITGSKISDSPNLIKGLAITKQGAALANTELGLMDKNICDAIVKACTEIADGKYHDHFVVDPVQGGAGTSTNMNANEVIANRALELLGHKRGEYKYCHPNNHVNLSQSTNDAYPTAVKLSIIYDNVDLKESLKQLIDAFKLKVKEFADIIKMGRTQLQDAVPMTLGQEFNAYVTTLETELKRLDTGIKDLYTINMGATAIGTGINSDPDYAQLATKHIAKISGLPITLAEDLIEATHDTGAFVSYSSILKGLAVKLSKICNDLRLMSSGPRTGFGEINLPPKQPGSSIMPGKVNPVIPEVVNQIAFRVIGNDLTVTFASEAAQLELNVMEPIMVHCISESVKILINGINTLRKECIIGITANIDMCKGLVYNSIGLVTALNPFIGYEASTEIAKEALETGKSVYELVLTKKLLTQSQLDDILKPENMVKPRKMS